MKINKFIISVIIAFVILSIQFVEMGYAQTTKGDLNNDGKIDIIDLGILLSSWGRVDRPPADLNQDGRVDIIDLGILLSNWGTGETPPPPTIDPKKGHTYPRTAIWQWAGAVPDWYARFDLAFTRINDNDFISQVKGVNKNIIWLPTEDFNTVCEPRNSWLQCQEDWILKDSSGNEVHATYGDNDANLAKFSGLTTTIPDRVKEVIDVDSGGLADGHGTDGLWGRLHYSWRTWSDVDMNLNRVNDIQEFGKSGTLDNWQTGIDQMLSEIRQRIGPNKYFIVNTGSGDTFGKQWVNGYVHEYHSWPETGNDWDSGRTYWTRVMTEVYQPPIFLQQSSPDRRDPATNNIHTKNFLRFIRWSLAESMLFGRYYTFEHTNGKSPDHYWNNYFDEFDLDLGYPTGAMQQLKQGVWVRFFERGVAIQYTPSDTTAWPQITTVTVTDVELRALSGYKGPYYRFLGGQDIALNGNNAMNNGQQSTSLNLQSYKYQGWADAWYVSGDGIILVKSPQTVVSDIVIEESEAGTSVANEPTVLSGGFALQDCNAGRNYYEVRCSWNPGTFSYAISPPGSGTATFTPNIGVLGRYEIFEWHGIPNSETVASNVAYVISHADGTTTKIVNQQINSGQWNSLGTYRFNQGTSGKVVISAEGVNGKVIADAIMFSYRG